MPSLPDVFFIQWAGADTPDEHKRWTTFWPYSYADRTDAEQSMLVLKKHSAHVPEVRASSSFIDRLGRRLRATKRRALRKTGLFEGLEDLQGRPYEVVGEVAMVLRVVSTSELRAESEDALREAEEETPFGTAPRGERLSFEASDASDEDA